MMQEMYLVLNLQSREATFGDFGAGEFIANSASCQGGNMQACQDMLGQST